MRKTEIIYVSSMLPAPVDVVWQKLLRVQTLHLIAAPYAVFTPVVPTRPVSWEEGGRYRFQTRIFHVIPVGLHTVDVEIVNPRTYTMQTRESNKMVKVWRHKIILTQDPSGYTAYTDILEIGAGRLLTGAVTLWAKAFLRHRQKKWVALLRGRR